MPKNYVRTTLFGNTTWTCPAGVTNVKVIGIATLRDQISGKGNSLLPLTMNADAFAWGQNSNGQLGDGTVVAKSSPVLVLGGLKYRQMIGANVSSMGLTANGDAYGMGGNASGQLGDGTVVAKSSPVLVLGGLKFREISGANNAGDLNDFYLGVNALTGAAYGWGNNSQGQLGQGDVIPKSSPVLVLGGFLWNRISCGGGQQGGFSLGIDNNQNAYAWGNNLFGQLGLNDLVPRSSPVLVLGGRKWLQISAGQLHSLAIDTHNDMYAWGNGNNGQLGDGTVNKRSSPVLVLGGLKWRRAYAGANFSLGITTSGVGYAWGINLTGQLGLNDLIPRSSPVMILGGKIWRVLNAGCNAATSAGIATDGNAYAWGVNSNGQIGDGTTVAKSSPVLVLGSNVYRAVDEAIVNELFVATVPGTTYTATIFAAIAQFGPLAVYSDASNSGSLPIRLVLEYFA